MKGKDSKILKKYRKLVRKSAALGSLFLIGQLIILFAASIIFYEPGNPISVILGVAIFIPITAFVLIFSNNSWLRRYELSDDEIKQVTFIGKKIKGIKTDEIKEFGLSREQVRHTMPKTIYLSKNVLSEEERGFLLLKGTDGSIVFFPYDRQLFLEIQKRCKIPATY